MDFSLRTTRFLQQQLWKRPLQHTFALLWCIFLLAGLLLTVPVAFATQGPFVDIAEDYPFINALHDLKDRGVIKGYPDQTFRPDQPITRAEFVKMSIVSAELPPDEEEIPPLNFTDVKQDDWFYNTLQSARARNIISGHADGSFRPHQPVSRAEALKISLELYTRFVVDREVDFSPEIFLDAYEPTGTLPRDITQDDWFMPYAVLARDLWVMTDYDDGLFRPHEPLTRGAAAEILYRLDQVMRNSLDQFDITSEWKTFQSFPGHFSVKMPQGYEVIPESTRTVFWKRDPNFLNSDYEFVTDYSAKLIIRSPKIETSADSSVYFDNIRGLTSHVFGDGNVDYTEVQVAGHPALHVKVPSEGVENWYVYIGGENEKGDLSGAGDEMSSGSTQPKALVLYGQFGRSSLTHKMRDTLRMMVRSLQYLPQTLPDTKQQELEQLLSTINGNILIEGQGQAMIDLIHDSIIIETDEIGVGTGPVDYIYSEELNITLKYERASDTLLAIRGSRTTLF